MREIVGEDHLETIRIHGGQNEDVCGVQQSGDLRISPVQCATVLNEIQQHSTANCLVTMLPQPPRQEDELELKVVKSAKRFLFYFLFYHVPNCKRSSEYPSLKAAAAAAAVGEEEEEE